LLNEDYRDEHLFTEELVSMILSLILWLGISLGCIFKGEEIGEGFIGAKMGLISSASPGWAVQLMGWIFLFLPGIVGVVYYIKGKGNW
jgi:hypothetical protein